MAACPSSQLCGSTKYPGQQLSILSNCTAWAQGNMHFDCGDQVRGAQSISYDPTLESTPIFQLSQSEMYELREGIPTVNITAQKVLDGHDLMYTKSTADAVTPTLFGRAPTKAIIGVGIFDCSADSTAGDPVSVTVFSGVQVNSISYTASVDNPAVEDITWLGNDIIYYNPNFSGDCECDYTDRFLAEVASIQLTGCNAGNDQAPIGPIAHRENVIFGFDSGAGLDQNGMVADPDTTILPPDIPGITCSGTLDPNNPVAVQSITISTSLNREDVNRLGERSPHARTLTLPVAVDTAIEVVSEHEVGFSATSYGVCLPPAYTGCEDVTQCSGVGVNAYNRTIRLALCEGTRVYTGIRNKLVSANRSGGSTGGENLTITYNFQTFNTMTVLHCNDQAASGDSWWTNRDQWLTDV